MGTSRTSFDEIFAKHQQQQPPHHHCWTLTLQNMELGVKIMDMEHLRSMGLEVAMEDIANGSDNLIDLH